MLAAGNNTANIAQCYEAAEAFMQYAREAEPKKQKYKGEGVEDIPVRTK